MFENYHRAIVDSQYEELILRAASDGWTNVLFEREGSHIYIRLQVSMPEPYQYLIHIDMTRYPVDPYWIGFINPDLPRSHWRHASDCDPRFWPWSPMPGLHGSFVIIFLGPFRTFWCRECNFPFFYYHGDDRWTPADWHLNRVVAHLREAVENAESPNRWRRVQQPSLLMAATMMGITLPSDAGLGAK